MGIIIWVAKMLLIFGGWGVQDTRYNNLYFTSDTSKQIALAIKANFRQTYYKANIQQVNNKL